jgi:hypothetical protein
MFSGRPIRKKSSDASSGTTDAMPAQRTARLSVLRFELPDQSVGLVVDGGEDLVGVLFRVVEERLRARHARRRLDPALHALEQGDELRGNLCGAPDYAEQSHRAGRFEGRYGATEPHNPNPCGSTQPSVPL